MNTKQYVLSERSPQSKCCDITMEAPVTMKQTFNLEAEKPWFLMQKLINNTKNRFFKLFLKIAELPVIGSVICLGVVAKDVLLANNKKSR